MEAAKWRVTITVFSPQKNTISESDVFPIVMTAEEIYDTGNYLVMSEKQVEKFSTSNGMPIKLSEVRVPSVSAAIH